MNRLTKAWRALTGALEPEVHVVPGGAAAGDLYCVEDRQWMNTHVGGFYYIAGRRWYRTCADAFAENPGKKVASAPAFRIGGKWYVRLTGVEVSPLPRRGRKAGAPGELPREGE